MVTPLVSEQGQVNCFHDESLEFYKISDKGWAISWQKVEPYSILRQQILQPDDVSFWNQEGLKQKKELFKHIPQFKFNRASLAEYSRLVSLYEFFAFDKLNRGYQQNLEIGTYILWNEQTNNIKFVVPTQTVSTTRVGFKDTLNKPCTDLFGETKDLQEWLIIYTLIGYCHSHNTLAVNTPSWTDDETELDFDGIHLLLSEFRRTEDSLIPQFNTYLSYSLHGERFQIDLSYLIESLDEFDENFYLENIYDEKVLDNVTIQKLRYYRPGKGNKKGQWESFNDYFYQKYFDGEDDEYGGGFEYYEAAAGWEDSAYMDPEAWEYVDSSTVDVDYNALYYPEKDPFFYQEEITENSDIAGYLPSSTTTVLSTTSTKTKVEPKPEIIEIFSLEECIRSALNKRIRLHLLKTSNLNKRKPHLSLDQLSEINKLREDFEIQTQVLDLENILEEELQIQEQKLNNKK